MPPASSISSGGLERRVRRLVGDVQKERLLLVAHVPDPVDGFAGVDVGVVLSRQLRDALAVALQVVAALVPVREVVAAGVQRAHEVVEAATVGMVRRNRVAEMPLADRRGVVALAPERLAHEMLADGDAERTPRVDGRVGQAELERVAPGQQRGAGGRALRVGVEAVQLDALGGQPVDAGRGYVAPVERRVVPAHVVREDDENVGPIRGLPGCLRGGVRQLAERKHCEQQESQPTIGHDGTPCCALPSDGAAPRTPGGRRLRAVNRTAGVVADQGRPGLYLSLTFRTAHRPRRALRRPTCCPRAGSLGTSRPHLLPRNLWLRRRVCKRRLVRRTTRQHPAAGDGIQVGTLVTAGLSFPSRTRCARSSRRHCSPTVCTRCTARRRHSR